MASLSNGGFESGADGVADGWAFYSGTTQSEALPLESFETGWDNTTDDLVVASFMFGGGEPRENFERLWGPADGSDAGLPDAVPPATYTENASFQTDLSLIAAGPALDSFEEWITTPYILDFDDLVYVTGDFEDFETGWDNDTFDEELEDGVTLETATFYEFDPQEIENFDDARIIDGHELITILTDPPPQGFYYTYINGIEFKTFATNIDTVFDIAIDLASVIDTSTYPFAAAQWLSEAAFYVRNLGTAPMLIRVEGPVGNGTDIRITTPLIINNFWLMPLSE